MNNLIRTGKKRTLLISSSLLLISIHTIYSYHAALGEIDVAKLMRQVVRFSLTVGFLVMVYKGKKWAKNFSLALFSIALLVGVYALITVEGEFINKVPLLVMVSVYSIAIFHFGFSKSYQAFFKFQNNEIENASEERMKEPEWMDAGKFWGIIEKSKRNSAGDYEEQQTELEIELLKLTANEIIEFDNKFKKLSGEINHWDFWAAAYLINGGCSDDCFSDFRDWLIGQGQTVFENAKNDIESLSELKDMNDSDWEGLGYVAATAYEEKTGNELPDGIEETTDILGEEWEEEGDDIKNKFPKLWAKFGDE